MCRSVLFLAVLVGWVLPVAAQDPPPSPLVGVWEGTLSIQGTRLRLALHVTPKDSGLSATLDSIDQGARGIPVDQVALDGHAMRFAIRALKVEYRGQLDAAAGTITGRFKQAGMDLPLDLRKVEKASELPRPQHPRPPFPYAEEPVGFSHTPGTPLADSFRPAPSPDDATQVSLAGTLSLPPGAGPHAAVVLVSGSGPQNRDEELLGHRPFAVLADYLARRGVAVLRYDDRGVAQSTGQFATATSADFTTDALAAVAYLKTRKEIAPERIGIIGHSEGGLIAPMAATASADVAFIVLLAGPAVCGLEILLHQTALLQRASLIAAAQIAREQPLRRAMLESVLSEDGTPEERTARVEAALSALYDAQPEAHRAQLPRAEFIAMTRAQLDTPWMRYFLRHDPAAPLRGVRCPVLAVWGSMDLQVDPAQNLPPMAKVLAETQHRHYALVVLPQLNHLFQRCGTGSAAEYATIEETFNPRALDVIGRWIEALYPAGQ